MRPAPDPSPAPGRAAVRAEMEQARQDFHSLLRRATAADLRRPSDGTSWTNQQLLFHMLFGYMIVRALLVLVRVFGLLPDGASKALARLLDSARKPFDVINYLGSCAGARIIPPRRMPGTLDRVIAALDRHLEREPDPALRRGMHYPTTWDPFFAGYMALADIYHYPTCTSASTSASSHSPRPPADRMKRRRTTGRPAIPAAANGSQPSLAC